MSIRIKPNGDIEFDTVDEAVAYARALPRAAPAPTPAPAVVGESISTDRWKNVHANDKRMTAAVEKLKAGREFFGNLTPLQRQACEMRIAGKWPHEIAKELGRTTGTIQAIIWDAGKRLARRTKGEPILTQAEISSMGGKAAKAKRDAVAPPSPSPPEPPAPPDPPPAAALPDRKQRACRKCSRPGHNARTCPGAMSERPPKPAPPADPPHGTVAPGMRFAVAEDFEEEDGTAWIADDVWEAIEPTGETVDEHAQWRLQRDGDGAEGIGYPGLHPFVRHDARAAGRSLHDITIQRVGMGPGASAAA